MSEPISQQSVEKSESVPNLQAVLREEAPVYSAEQRSKDDPQVSVTATESEKQTDEKPRNFCGGSGGNDRKCQAGKHV